MNQDGHKQTTAAPREQAADRALQDVRDMMAGTQYGEVTVTMQDGVPVGVTQTRKVRYPVNK